MWMLTDAEFLLGRREVGWTRVVHQEEGGDVRGDVAIRKNIPDRKAVADPVVAITALDESNFFHTEFPLVVL